MLAAARPGIRHQVAIRHAVTADNFNRADSTSVINPASDGNAWVIETGTWGISSNRGYMSSITGGGTSRTAQGFICISTDPGYATVDIKVTNTRANNAGYSAVIFAADTAPAGKALYLRFDASASALIAYDGSTSTTLASGFLTAWTGGSTQLRILYDPSSGLVRILQNGVLKLTSTLASTYRYSGTLVALGSQVSTAGEYWDDFNLSGTLPTVFTDDFNRADNTSSVGGTGWTVRMRNSAHVTPSWGLLSGRAYATSTPTYGGTLSEALLLQNLGTGDFDMTVTLASYTSGSFDAPIAAFRADPTQDDGNNGLGYFLLTKNYLYLLRSNEGGSSTWAVQPGGTFDPFVSGDVARILAVGSSIKVYRNGVLAINATAVYNQTAPCHGLAGYASPWDRYAFDDFTVTY
jgi:hypothetical protein